MKRARLLLGAVLLLAAAAAAVAPGNGRSGRSTTFSAEKARGSPSRPTAAWPWLPRRTKSTARRRISTCRGPWIPTGPAISAPATAARSTVFGKDGKAELYFQTSEMDVTRLLTGPKGVLYAGTSPNGRIYKITAPGKGQELFNPEERYIWDLVLSPAGSLLAAVGESGGIYEISPEGSGRPVFKSDQNHILCLKLGSDGALTAGSGGAGLVYRLEKNGGKTVVVFETPFEEVRAAAFDPEGNLYVWPAARSRRRAERPFRSGRRSRRRRRLDRRLGRGPGGRPGRSGRRPAGRRRRPQGARGRLPDRAGRPGPADLVFARGAGLHPVLERGRGEALFRHRSERALYTLDRREKAALLLQSEAEQAYACVPDGPRFYLLSNNPAGLSRISPGRRLSGEYQGPVWDANLTSQWGRIEWEAVVPEGGALQLQSRSGNTAEPGPTWSDWSPPCRNADGEPILSPKGRYLQVRALFKSTSAESGPVLSKLNVNFLQANAAPEVTRLEILGPHEVYLKPPDMNEAIWGLESRLPDAGTKPDEIRMIAAKKRSGGAFGPSSGTDRTKTGTSWNTPWP